MNRRGGEPFLVRDTVTASPPKHPDELVRLERLYDLGVLDTEAEERFDDLTALAAQICDTPIALVSLVDAERQWFKSHRGLDACETDLSRSVCSYTILSPEVLVIEDTTKDPRTATNPLVTGEILMRFYAGAPLIGRDGFAYGALCVIDTKPRKLTDDQVRALERLAAQVVALLEAGVVIREREAALEQADTLKAEIDHRVANSLQQVAVLLRLQARHIVDEKAKEAVELAQLRLEAISSFHRTVSSLSDGYRVSLRDVIARLSGDLAEILPARVKLEQDIPDVQMAARSATGLALILNEFLANSQKYAFPDDRAGTVRLAGSVEDGIVTLVFSDDGIGWQGKLPEARSSGIGMRVIEASVESLSGEMDMSGEGGCTMKISFPLAAVQFV